MTELVIILAMLGTPVVMVGAAAYLATRKRT